jgi:hypothetical protein
MNRYSDIRQNVERRIDQLEVEDDALRLEEDDRAGEQEKEEKRKRKKKRVEAGG